MTESLAQLITEQVIEPGSYQKIIVERAQGRSRLVVDCGDAKFQIKPNSVTVIPANGEDKSE